MATFSRIICDPILKATSVGSISILLASLLKLIIKNLATLAERYVRDKL